MKTPWTLRAALRFVRDLEWNLGNDFHVGLIGSVLINGWSERDLDIVIYPHRRPARSLIVLHRMLHESGLKMLFDADEVKQFWEKKELSHDRKHVEVWYTNKRPRRRVDIFLMR